MTRIQLLGTSIMLLALFSNIRCGFTSNIQAHYTRDMNCINEDFKHYSTPRNDTNYERMAVISSFVGDYENATRYATYRENLKSEPEFLSQKFLMPQEFNEMVDSLSRSGNRSAHLLPYYFENSIDSIGEIFANYKIQSAKDYIISNAASYHFILLNEAHYCGQHRAFTKELLEPLWELGYRYLALEGLKNNLDSPSPTSPPKLDDGYYIREVNYGLLLREAYRIGFKVVPYESINSSEGTAREKEQAFNIFNNTLAKDSIGKVIVHAGYSHINENGDVKFRPMANMLKSISKKDIFSIDQQNMTEMLDEKKMNAFYKYAIKNYQLDEASVFIDEKGTVLVDPINCLGIDIQVYHPKTKYTHGRPHWMITSKNKFIALPAKFATHKGLLVEARLVQEDCSSVPLDRLIISDEDDNNYLLLEAGSYVLMVFDKSGKVIDRNLISVD